MGAEELATLIEEHTQYCIEKYQPNEHITLEFQDRMIQSLTHFGMWLRTVKLKNKP